MENFNDAQFRERVDKALTQVRKILKAERNPTYMESVQHTYSDKFGLAEFLTNISLAAQINCFQMMGIEGANLYRMHDWVKVDPPHLQTLTC
eukprot:1177244-Prorocentrum_minimum.AAC.3